MINRSEVKDARINIEGDKLACQKWLSFAYSKLAVQWDLYKKTNAISSKAYKPNNDTTIICSVKPGGNKWIYIKAGSTNSSINGIIKSSYIDTSDNTLHDYLGKNAPLPKKWIKTPKLAIKPSTYFNFTNTGNSSQHAYIKSSMYSGVMRKYMQIVLGTNVEHKFDYKWEKTHAFQFTTVPTTIKEKIDFETFKDRHQFWLVEIGSAGCFIARADIYIPKFKSNSDLDSFPFIPQTYQFPTGEVLTSAIANKSAYQLYSAAEMEGFYKDSFPFFKECGWSSGDNSDINGYLGSNTGTYMNTCYKLIDGIWTSQVWRIGITINGFPSGSGVSVSKFKQIAASGKMWSSSNNSGINVPDYDNDCIKTLSFNSFNKPFNGIFNFPWHVNGSEILYSKSANISLYIPSSGNFQNGGGDTVNLAHRTSLMSKLPIYINNGSIAVEDYMGSQTSGIAPFIVKSTEIGYVVPMYDRDAYFINTNYRTRAYYYNKNTGQVTEAANPVKIDPDENTGNLGNQYIENEMLSMKKSGILENRFLPIYIYGSYLNNSTINEMNHSNSSLHVELVTNAFFNKYNNLAYTTPYTSLYRSSINNVIYSYLNGYVNYSATINSNVGTNNVSVDTYPVYGGDEITNFSFVGKP